MNSMFNEATFWEHFSHLPDDGKSISHNGALLDVFVHDMINVLY